MKTNNRTRKKRIFLKLIVVIIVLFISIFILDKIKINNSETIEQEKKHNTETIEQEKKDAEKKAKKSDWKLILVNKEHKLPNNFTVKLKSIDNANKIDERIYNNYIDMINNAKNDGINLTLISSYRTVERSEYLFKRQVNNYLKQGYTQKNAEMEAEKWVARPYTSEHHTGLAVDILTPSYTVLDHNFKTTTAYKWLLNNSYKYGFVLRYAEDKQNITKYTFEPWHYRFVGVENAKFMVENNLCLEEFLGM